MDFRHLDDFVSLCETRSFSRSAAARNVTQSAFSRRIQALELWLGAPLIDRSSFPTTLTVEGRLFRETAEEILRLALEVRQDLETHRQRSRKTVTFAALHTLAVSTFPTWLRRIEARTGPLKTEVLSDHSHNCIQALIEGRSDFLLTFHHDAIPSMIDAERFPFIVLGEDRLLAVTSAGDGVPLHVLSADPPLLAYGAHSFLGRLSVHAMRRWGLDLTTTHVNDNAIAEVLKAMVLAGHGIAWLPESLIATELENGTLQDLGAHVPMEIRLYRSSEKRRQAVTKIWDAAAHLLQ